MSNNTNHDRFLFPLRKYRGRFTPQHLAFDANLQEFTQRVEYLCALETNGKIPPEQAYEQIKELYEQLTTSKEVLEIGNEPSSSES